MTRQTDSFWTRRTGNGGIHDADRASPAYCPDLLIVFVHGITGNWRETWPTLPQDLLAQLEIDCDVYSFGFDSQFWHSVSVGTAARDLLDDLTNFFPTRRHYVFITHSTGGLIVREMFRRAVPAALRLIDKDMLSKDVPLPVCLCTRNIIYLDPPFLGGDFLLSWAAALVNCVWGATLGPLLWVAARVLRSKSNLGTNRIVFQLAARNPWLKRLRTEYAGLIGKLVDRRFAIPHEFEILGRVKTTLANDWPGDQVDEVVTDDFGNVRRIGNLGVERTTVWGDHVGMKLIDPGKASVDTVCAWLLRKFRNKPGHVIAERSFHRLVTVPKNKVIYLAGRDEDAEPEQIGVVGLYSQQECFEETMRRLNNEDRAWRLVVTGAAGLGKTSVLRYALRTLAAGYLASVAESPYVPIFITLREVKIAQGYFEARKSGPSAAGGRGQAASPLALWSILIDGFCASARQLVGVEGLVTPCWIDDQIRHRPTVVFLDGIDEFVMLNAALELSHVEEMLSAVITEYGANSRLGIVSSIRWGLPGLSMLAEGRSAVLRLQPLREREITRIFPAMADILNGAISDRIKEILCSPLLAAEISQSPVTASMLRSEADVLDLAIRSRIERSGLTVDVRDGKGQRVPYEKWKAALAFSAWRYFEGFRGTMDVPTLKAEASDALARWRTLPDETRYNEETVWLHEGIDLILREDTLRALLVRSFFESAIEAAEHPRYRFEHYELFDYLVGYFLTYCIIHDRHQEYGQRGVLARNLQLAGMVLADSGRPVDEVTVGKALEATLATKRRFIFGNFGTVLGYSVAPLTGPAIHMLFGGIDVGRENVNPALRHTLIGGLTARAWAGARGAISDKSTDDIGRAVKAVLLRLLEGGKPSGVNPITQSMAWCYCKALGLSAVAAEHPWPKPLANEECVSAALVLVDESPSGAINNDSRAFQYAFLQVQTAALANRFRRIAAAHYLFSLVATVAKGRHLSDVGYEVRQLLAEGSDYESAVREVSEVPELMELLETMRSILRAPPA